MIADAWLAELNVARQARRPAARHAHALHDGRELVVIQKHGAHLGSGLWHAALPLAHYLDASGLRRRRSGRRALARLGVDRGDEARREAPAEGRVLLDPGLHVPRDARGLPAAARAEVGLHVVAEELPPVWNSTTGLGGPDQT